MRYGGITLKNVLDLSVLHSFLTIFNRKTLFPIFTSKVLDVLLYPVESSDLIQNTEVTWDTA